MMALLRIADVLHQFCKHVSRIGSWLLLVLIAVIVFDVITRKFGFAREFVETGPLGGFFSPTKLQELEWHLHAVIFLMSFGFAYLHGTHVRVDLWREKRSERSRAVIELLAILLLAMPYCGILVFYAWDFVVTSYQQGEGSPALTGLPNRWIIKSFLLFGVVILFAALISTLIRLVAFLTGSDTVRDRARDSLVMVRVDDAGSQPAEQGIQ